MQGLLSRRAPAGCHHLPKRGSRKRAFAAATATAALVGVLAACSTPVPPPPTNVAPTASATADSTTPATGSLVGFSSAGSVDPDGSIASYSWDFGDGGTSTEANPSHVFQTSGAFTVQLLVTDDDGALGSAQVEVTVGDDPAGHYVAPTGTDSGDCTSSLAKCLTIGYAVTQAGAGDTVYVAAGAYPEIVNPTKALTFSGPNVGIPAGVDAGARGPEAVVRAFRGGLSNTSWQDLRIDGFEIDPTSDPALLTNALAMINVFGGPNVDIVNNVFTGAHTFFPDCSYTCTNMADYAIQVRAGDIAITDNDFVNWRRPVNVTQSDATRPITSDVIARNTFTGITSRAMSIGQNTGQSTMAGSLVEDNVVDSTGRGPASTPAGITITNANNVVTDNTFRGVSSAVYIQLCKKWSQNGNQITGNAFEGNGAGVNVTTFLDTSQCNSSATEGSGGWVLGGGRAEGLVVTGNSFEGQTSYAVRFNPDYGTYTHAITTGPLDATCNWYGAASGPTDPLVPGERVVQGPPTNAQWVSTPWLTTPTGPCDGGL